MEGGSSSPKSFWISGRKATRCCACVSEECEWRPAPCYSAPLFTLFQEKQCSSSGSSRPQGRDVSRILFSSSCFSSHAGDLPVGLYSGLGVDTAEGRRGDRDSGRGDLGVGRKQHLRVLGTVTHPRGKIPPFTHVPTPHPDTSAPRGWGQVGWKVGIKAQQKNRTLR